MIIEITLLIFHKHIAGKWKILELTFFIEIWGAFWYVGKEQI